MSDLWTFRPGTVDRLIFNDVVGRNEYQLPDRFALTDIVIDIGAHIGAFAFAVVERGGRQVWCFEPDRDNCRLAAAHLQPSIDAGWVRVSQKAVWRSDRDDEQLRFDGYQPFPASFPELQGIVNTAAPLAHVDRVIQYAQFGRGKFEGAFQRLREKHVVSETPPVDIIPHGVDRHRFYPFPELTQASFASPARARAKARVFGNRVDPESSFIVLNASRLDTRKRVDLTVQGFAKFAADKPAAVKLCLHHAIMNDENEQELRQWIRQCKLEDRVLLNPLGSRIVEDEELNWLYNACDVGINTSMGEGWGLVNSEHGAAGAAQIVPDHTACAELWRDRGELIPPARFFIPPITVLEMGEVSPDAVARALDNLYTDPARCRTLARAAAEAALDPAISWDVITRQFDDLFTSLSAPI